MSRAAALTRADWLLRNRAMQIYQKAIYYEEIERPLICSRCHQRSEQVIEGHHTDYAEPLRVTWLCHECHMNEHRRLRKTKV